LSRAQRLLSTVGVVTTLVTGYALLPFSVPPAHILAQAAWPAMALLVSLGLRQMLDRDSAQMTAGLSRDRDGALDAAYRRGRRLVVDLAAAEAAATRERYASVHGTLPQPIAAEVERRLADIGIRLTELRRSVESTV
jgi:hypothetical protein